MSRALPRSASLRARRWDVLVLGGALSGLAAAVRLGSKGLRVCVVEEDEAARQPSFLREPFFLPGLGGAGPLDAALRELGLPPIERRDLVIDPVAFQVLLPTARVDVGRADLLGSELVSWGLAKPETAERFVEAIAAAGKAAEQRIASLEWIRRSGLRGLARGTREAAPMPPLPDALRTPPPALAPLLAAWTRACTGPANASLPPEALARLLAAPLAGGACFARPDTGLRALLQRRIESLHGEFRTLSGPFRLAELGQDPGVARIAQDDVWLGRALILNAPAARLRAALRGYEQETPRWLDGPAPAAREVRIHARALRDAVPEPLARRAVLATATSGCGSADWPVTLLQEPSARGPQFVELVAGAVFPSDCDVAAAEDTLAARLGGLLPFAGNRVRRANAVPQPLWDDESARFEALPGSWPHGLELRASRAVYRLGREHVAALGAEGEILLGVRAGDAILADLS
jgi:FAD binding domain